MSKYQTAGLYITWFKHFGWFDLTDPYLILKANFFLNNCSLNHISRNSLQHADYDGLCGLKGRRWNDLWHVAVVDRMKGDTPVNSTMSVGQARKLVEQLKIEASFCRIKVKHTGARLTFRRAKGVSRHHDEQIKGRNGMCNNQYRIDTGILNGH